MLSSYILVMEVGGSLGPEAHVVVAMPAFNEEGLVSYLVELCVVLSTVADRLTFAVVDDCSTLPVVDQLRTAQASGVLPASLSVEVGRNERNLGHGPSVVRAYRMAMALGADLVLHVDSDGQFAPTDLAAILVDLEQADVVHGIRIAREDPWYRSVITRGLRAMLRRATGANRDPNCPLRGYRRRELAVLLAELTPESLIPHVHLSALAWRHRMRVHDVEVTSRTRRGDGVGTMWCAGRTANWLPPRRLLGFCGRALTEWGHARSSARPQVGTPAGQPVAEATWPWVA